MRQWIMSHRQLLGKFFLMLKRKIQEKEDGKGKFILKNTNINFWVGRYPDVLLVLEISFAQTFYLFIIWTSLADICSWLTIWDISMIIPSVIQHLVLSIIFSGSYLFLPHYLLFIRGDRFEEWLFIIIFSPSNNPIGI